MFYYLHQYMFVDITLNPLYTGLFVTERSSSSSSDANHVTRVYNPTSHECGKVVVLLCHMWYKHVHTVVEFRSKRDTFHIHFPKPELCIHPYERASCSMSDVWDVHIMLEFLSTIYHYFTKMVQSRHLSLKCIYQAQTVSGRVYVC